MLLLHQTPPIARIQLNAPKTLNALTLDMGKSLKTYLDELENLPNIKVVIIESLVEKAFSVGIDLKEFHENNHAEFRNEFLHVWNSIRRFKKPIIMALNGYVMGGGLELALKGDILISTDTALFSQPELNVGTLPGLGATQYLPRRLGHAYAAHMILGGLRLSAQTAHAMGLISQVVNEKILHATATEIAHHVSTYSLPLLIQAKEALQFTTELPLTQGLQKEQDLFLNTFNLYDQTEGFEAFLNKRSPNFKNV